MLNKKIKIVLGIDSTAKKIMNIGDDIMMVHLGVFILDNLNGATKLIASTIKDLADN